MPFREKPPPPADILLAPHWRIQGAPLEQASASTPGATSVGPATLRVSPGPGFGNGTHETTQLCLLALAHFLRVGRAAPRVLDFGAGSGILSVAAAKLGATVEAVEIDGAARRHAVEIAELNGVGARIDVRTTLGEPPRAFELVVANILRAVLIEFAEALALRTSPQGCLVLSGLVATDVPHIVACYGKLMAGRTPQVYERGEWRAVVYPRLPA